MKINSITQSIAYSKGRTNESSIAMERKSANTNKILRQNNNDQINTTIEKKISDGRVSFKGGAPFLHKAANAAIDNPLLAEALFALVITCGARPLTILATARTEEEKEKCSYQAAKSISSGLVGLATTILISQATKAGVQKAMDKGWLNHPIVRDSIEGLKDFVTKNKDELNEKATEDINKFIQGNKINLNEIKDMEEKFLSNISSKDSELATKVKNAITQEKAYPKYLRTCKDVMDKLLQPICLPIRAMITTAMVPVIIKSLGISKDGKKSKEAPKPIAPTFDYSRLKTAKQKELFKPFMEVTNNENK